MRITDPKLVHPTDKNKFSWFRIRELARIQGLKDSFKLSGIKTRDTQIIGNGVCVEAFYTLGLDILKHLKEA